MKNKIVALSLLVGLSAFGQFGTSTGVKYPYRSTLTDSNVFVVGAIGLTNFNVSWATMKNSALVTGTKAGTNIIAQTNGAVITFNVAIPLRYNPYNTNMLVIAENLIGVILSGVAHTNVGEGSVILGGEQNRIHAGGNAFIGAGRHNFVNDGNTFIGSGVENYVEGTSSVVVGGNGNSAGANSSFVGGGWSNWISSVSDFGAILGGYSNRITSKYSMAIGNYLSVTNHHSVAIGHSNKSLTVLSNGQLLTWNGPVFGETVNGFTLYGATNDNNYANSGEDRKNLILMGLGNTNVGAQNALIGSGNSQQIDTAGSYSAIVAGGSNYINSPYGFIGGGVGNRSIGNYAVMVGGWSNSVLEQFAFIGGGQDNSASGAHSSVLGGTNNVASGKGAQAVGNNLRVTNPYEVQIGHGTNSLSVASNGVVSLKSFNLTTNADAVTPDRTIYFTNNGAVYRFEAQLVP